MVIPFAGLGGGFRQFYGLAVHQNNTSTTSHVLPCLSRHEAVKEWHRSAVRATKFRSQLKLGEPRGRF